MKFTHCQADTFHPTHNTNLSLDTQLFCELLGFGFVYQPRECIRILADFQLMPIEKRAIQGGITDR